MDILQRHGKPLRHERVDRQILLIVDVGDILGQLP
jgi:hypothetical protein